MSDGKVTEMSEKFSIPDNEVAKSDRAERVDGSESPLITSERGGLPQGVILSTGNKPSPANSFSKKSEYRSKASLMRRRSTKRLIQMKEG